MKYFLYNMLFVTYILTSMVVLIFALVFPGMRDFPSWYAWIIYPLAIIVSLSSKRTIRFFEKKNVL